MRDEDHIVMIPGVAGCQACSEAECMLQGDSSEHLITV